MLAKKLFQFLSKNKGHIFHFHYELHWTTYLLFCFTTFHRFSSNFIILSCQNFWYFWAKSCSSCLFQTSSELEFFPLRGLCKDWNRLRSEGAISREYIRWIRTSQPCCNSLCLIFKETCSLPLSWRNITGFLFTNSRYFSSSAAFSWSNWEQYCWN